MSAKLAYNTSSSVVVDHCQICDSTDLEEALFIGYLPPVNQMRTIGERPHEQPAYPALWLRCPRCELVQLGLIVDPKILFPPEYPYTSSTTKILRENFAELYRECATIIKLGKDDLIVDIGSNDGNLLSNFMDNHRVLGVTPEDIGKIAIERGIPTIQNYFTHQVALDICSNHGQAKLVTATNVFAHIENINEIVESVLEILAPEGMFISESHYLISLLETLQYDTIYHEHLRYYSLHSLQYLLNSHGLEVVHTKKIPTHGGSIRVYAARKGQYPVQTSVQETLNNEKNYLGQEQLMDFKRKVVNSKLQLHALLLDIKKKGQHIYGIGAPSRASTLINYVGLDDGIIDCVLEVLGSHKTGKYMPGTLIPVLEESKLFEDQPEFALLFSWHIAEELMPKLAAKGYMGSFIIPLPEPRIVHWSGND